MPEVENTPQPGIDSTPTLMTAFQGTSAPALLHVAAGPIAAPVDQAEVVDAALIGVAPGL